MSGELVVFLEGKTEVNTIETLKSFEIIRFGKYIEYRNSGKLKEKIYRFLAPIAGEPINMVVLRDLDSEVSIESVIQSTEDVLKKVYSEIPVKFVKHEQYPNIFLFIHEDAEIKIVMHIAEKCSIDGLPEFKNCTTDDYVLDLALRPETIFNLKEFNEIKKKNSDLTPEEIQNKIISEVPDLLSKNGINLNEAKNFVNLYILVLQLDGAKMRYADLPGKVIKYAHDGDIEEVFESWIAAFNIFREGANEQ
jgi:hypothetical protein